MYCCNKIKTNDPNVISAWITKSKYGEDFDFNKVIPMPKGLDIVKIANMDESIVYYLTNRFQQPIENKDCKKELICCEIEDIEKSLKEMSKEELDKLYELGKQYMLNKEKYGYYTWYDWRDKFWGSYYNSADTKYSDEHPCEVSFKTMWVAPIKIFEKMCSMFPNAKIEFCCEEYEGDIRKFVNDNGALKEIYGEE